MVVEWNCHPVNIIRAFEVNKWIKFLNLRAWVSIQLAQHRHPVPFQMPRGLPPCLQLAMPDGYGFPGGLLSYFLC